MNDLILTSKAWSYQRQPDGKDEWLTPPKIIHSLGVFDLDPCSPVLRPWDTARSHINEKQNGMEQPWHGRVWCNPPYKKAAHWLARCSDHGNAIAMVFARTETQMFFNCIWDSADAILFLKGRITFLNVDGSKPKWTSGGPSCLVAWGAENVEALHKCGLDGKLIVLKSK